MAGQIIQRGERTWMVRVFRGRDPKTGKRRYLNKTIHGTKKDAQRYLNGVLRDVDLGVFVEPSQKTLGEYLDDWLAAVSPPRLRASTHASYTQFLGWYIRPVLGDRRLSSVTPLDVQKVLSAMGERGLGANTQRRAHMVLSAAFAQAVKWRLLQHNPARGAELPPAPRSSRATLTAPEAAALISASAGQYRALFSVAIAGGLRPGELQALRWEDVDWARGAVLVRQALYEKGGGEGWVFTEPKTAKGRRAVPLPPSTLSLLREHRKGQAEATLQSPGYARHGFVFAGPGGEPLRRYQVRAAFVRGLRSAGVKRPLRLYDLRHTCATLLLEAGVNPKVVSERLGHTTVALTLDVYSHVTPGMQEEAARALELLLSAPAGRP